MKTENKSLNGGSTAMVAAAALTLAFGVPAAAFTGYLGPRDRSGADGTRREPSPCLDSVLERSQVVLVPVTNLLPERPPGIELPSTQLQPALHISERATRGA